jgi:hypothetical protein
MSEYSNLASLRSPSGNGRGRRGGRGGQPNFVAMRYPPTTVSDYYLDDDVAPQSDPQQTPAYERTQISIKPGTLESISQKAAHVLHKVGVKNEFTKPIRKQEQSERMVVVTKKAESLISNLDQRIETLKYKRQDLIEKAREIKNKGRRATARDKETQYSIVRSIKKLDTDLNRLESQMDILSSKAETITERETQNEFKETMKEMDDYLKDTAQDIKDIELSAIADDAIENKDDVEDEDGILKEIQDNKDDVKSPLAVDGDSTDYILDEIDDNVGNDEFYEPYDLPSIPVPPIKRGLQKQPPQKMPVTKVKVEERRDS